MAAELYFMAPTLMSQESTFMERMRISAYILMRLNVSQPTVDDESRMKTTSVLGPQPGGVKRTGRVGRE